MGNYFSEKLLELIIYLNKDEYILPNSEDKSIKQLDKRIMYFFDTVGADPELELNPTTLRQWRSRKKIPDERLILMRDSMNDNFDKLRNRIIEINGYNAVRIYKKLIDEKQIPANIFKKIAPTKETPMELCASILTIYFYFCVISSLNNNDSDIDELVRKYELTVKQPDFESFLKKYSEKLDPYNNNDTYDNNPSSDIIDIYVHSADANEEELTINELLRDTTKNKIVLIGQSGSGKTYSLKNFAAKQGEGKYIYIPLEKYKIYKSFDLKTTPDWIIFYIMYKCLLDDNFFYPEQISLEHKEIISQLIEEFCKSPYNGSPNYTLMLDNYNKIYPEYKDYFTQELTSILDKWKNVRVITTTTDKSDVYDNAVFKTFNFYIVTGIKKELQNLKHPLFDEKKYEILKEFKLSLADVITAPLLFIIKKLGFEEKDGVKELLSLPLIYNTFITNKEDLSFGKTFDKCITNYPGNDTTRFILQLVIPLLAQKYGISFKRAQLLSTIDIAIKVYVRNDYIFHGFFMSLNISYKTILKRRKSKDWIEIILNNCPFFEKNIDESFSFSDKLLMHCFKAKHIVNAINALYSVHEFIEYKELSNLASELDINSGWFNYTLAYDDYECCKLIGEIAHVDKNKGEFNIVNKLLDICRKQDLIYGVHNALSIIYVLQGIANKTNFSSLFTIDLPSNLEYYNCFFSNCRIVEIPLFDSFSNKLYTYTQNDSIMIILFEHLFGPDIYIWDRKKDKLIDHYNFNEYSDKAAYYFTEFYKGAPNTVILLSKTHILYFEFDVENHRGNITRYINSSDPIYEVFHNHYLEHKYDFPDLSDEFLEEVITSYNIFHDCDFTGIKIDDEEHLRLLKKMIEKDENEAWPDKLSSYFQNN